MKLATLFAATLATTTYAAQAAGAAFNTPVTYTQTAAMAHPAPVVLERVIVTPTRRYAESEWHVHMASKKPAAQLYPVRSERRIETRSGNNVFRILLPLQ